MINIPQKHERFTVAVYLKPNNNVIGHKIAELGECYFTSSRDFDILCPCCGQKMWRDGFTKYQKLIFSNKSGRFPFDVRNVTFIVIENGKEPQKISVDEKSLQLPGWYTEIIPELRFARYHLQRVTCPNQACSGKPIPLKPDAPPPMPSSTPNETHVLLPESSVAGYPFTSSMIELVIELKPLVDQYLADNKIQKRKIKSERRQEAILKSIKCNGSISVFKVLESRFSNYVKYLT